MSQTPPSTRRDPRKDLPPGTAFVEFEFAGPDGHHRRGEVVMVSTSGLGFILNADPGVNAGTILVAASVHVGNDRINGDLSVRYSEPTDRSRIEFGCLFYPASLEDSTRWMAFAGGNSNYTGSPDLHLPMRCSNCQSTVWIFDDGQTICHCSACKQVYDFGKRLRGRQSEELYQRARGMATELGIDLASAISMLLGILKLSEVQDVLGDIPATEPSAPTPGARRERGFDPAYRPAIEAGTLTRSQAAQRGNRESFAKGLIARHRISLDDAYAVADNRASLLSVIRKRTAGSTVRTRYGRPVVSSRFSAIAGLSVMVLLALLGVLRQLDGTIAHAPVRQRIEENGSALEESGIGNARLPTPAPSAQISLDPTGQLTRINASRPEAVLLAYCEKLGRVPLSLAAGVIPDPNLWLGIHHDNTAFGVTSAIAIRKDHSTGRWTAGDGSSPIQVLTPDPAHLGETHDLGAAGRKR